MFTFDNVLTAGTVLVRQQIESQDWTPSGGASGWYVGSDGTASFNNATIRGMFQIGPNPGAHIISVIGPPGAPGAAAWEFFTGLTVPTQESAPAVIYAVPDGSAPTVPQFVLKSAASNNGTIVFVMDPPNPVSGYGVALLDVINATVPGTPSALFEVGTAIQTQLLRTDPVSGAGNFAPLIIGTPAGQSLAFSKQEIQSANAGAVTDLFIQSAGGRAVIPAGGTGWNLVPLLLGNTTGTALVLHAFGMDAGSNGTLNQPLYLNNNSSAGIACAAMRAGQFGPDTTGRATTSTSYAAVNGTTDAFTMTRPPSGRITINITTLMAMAPLSASKKGNITFEIKDGSSGGSAIWNGNDAYSIQLWDNECTEGAVTRSGSWTVDVGAASTGVLWIRPVFKSSIGTSTLTVTNMMIAASPSL